MKAFTIVYATTVSEDALIQAENKKEALKKFRKAKPDVRILDVQEWDESFMETYDGN